MLVHILMTIPAALAFILIAIRCLGFDKITVAGHTFNLSVEQPGKGATITAYDIALIVIWALFSRAFIYYFGSYISPLFGVTDPTNWGNYDGHHYLKLAELGYDGYIEDGKHLFVVFFPLYPWLIRALHVIISDYAACAYIISNAAFAAGCAYFYALLASEYSKKVAFRGVVLLSVFPFAFYFGAIRTESLFFFTSMASLYYIRKHRFLTASIFGCLAALTRMQGFLLVIPAAVEIITYYKPIPMLMEKRFKDFWNLCLHKVSCLFIIVAGTLSYLLLNYVVTGDPFEFMVHQKEHWYSGFLYFTKCLEVMYNQINGSNVEMELILWIPQIALFIFSFIVLVYGIRRVPAAYSAYFIMYLIINYSLAWPLSSSRYMTGAIPLFLILAESSRRHNYIYKTLLIIFAMAMAILIPLFLQNKYLY